MNQYVTGRVLKELRERNKMTQRELAEKLGVSDNCISKCASDIIGLNRAAQEILDVTVGDITRVLDEGPAVAFRAGTDGVSSEKIFDMLDLFYANKHMYAVKYGRDPYAGPLHISIRTRRTDSGSADGNEPHIALKNIRHRLDLMCGGRLTIKSGNDGGTVVTIMIPAN